MMTLQVKSRNASTAESTEHYLLGNEKKPGREEMKLIEFIRKEKDWDYIFLEYIVPVLCGLVGSLIGMALMVRLGIW